MLHNNNGQQQTRKEYREERARQDRKGPIILQVAYYLVRTLIALVFKIIEFFKS